MGDAMNCQVVQNKILALPDPRLIPDSLRQHVAGCPACQAWAKQAARLEALLEQLPTPLAPADKKDAMIGDLTSPRPIITRPPATPAPRREPRESPVLTFLRRNAAVVGGLAAAVLVAVGVWWLFPKNGPKPETVMPEDPFLKRIVQRDLQLAKAATPAERLRALGGLADDLSAQARGLARVAGANELNDLARWYDKAVKDGVVNQVEKLPVHAMPPEEEQKLRQELAAKLGETAAEVDKLLGEVPPEAKPALQRIADSARDGQKQLQRVHLQGEPKGLRGQPKE
jgi:hypothetical protein